MFPKAIYYNVTMVQWCDRMDLPEYAQRCRQCPLMGYPEGFKVRKYGVLIFNISQIIVLVMWELGLQTLLSGCVYCNLDLTAIWSGFETTFFKNGQFSKKFSKNRGKTMMLPVEAHSTQIIFIERSYFFTKSSKQQIFLLVSHLRLSQR